MPRLLKGPLADPGSDTDLFVMLAILAVGLQHAVAEFPAAATIPTEHVGQCGRIINSGSV